MAEPLRGKKDLEDAVRTGRDINADLDRLEPGESETRVEAAVALAIMGASYTTIARQLKFSSAYRARVCVERALAQMATSPEERDKQRVLIAGRLNRLLSSVMGKALDPRDPQHLPYNQQALRLVDRQARLYGVDAPTESVVYTPDQKEINEYLAKVLALAGQTPTVEADILDLTTIDDIDQADLDGESEG